MSDVTKANDGIYLWMQQRAIRELAVRKIIESTLKIIDSHLKTSLRTGHHCIDTSCGADLPWSTKVVERQRGLIRTHESSKCTIENHEIPWRVTLCHLGNWGETKEKNSNKTKETLQEPSFKGKHSITKHENLFLLHLATSRKLPSYFARWLQHQLLQSPGPTVHQASSEKDWVTNHHERAVSITTYINIRQL